MTKRNLKKWVTSNQKKVVRKTQQLVILQRSLRFMPPLTTTMNKLLSLMSHRIMVEMKIPNNLLRVKVINKVVIRASTSLLPSSLLKLMLNLIIPTMLPKQLYKNAVNSYTIAINTMMLKLSN